MRAVLAGIFLLLLFSPVAFAQSKGEVESVGLGGYMRPDTWCPMVIRLKPGTLEAGTYQIQVEQRDRDDDTQVFTRTITVNSSDQAREQRFWMYFLPETVNGRLADTRGLREINQELKVWLCTEKGRQIEPLPITATVQDIDENMTGHPIGRKFILAVSDTLQRPQFMEFGASYGVNEDVAMISVRPDELPESSLGYDGVDAIVWMDGDASTLSAAGARRLPALTSWIKQGGKLIVTQPADRSKVEALASLLPIEIKQDDNWLIQMQNRSSLEPLRSWAAPPAPSRLEDPWSYKAPPLKVARASQVKPGAVVAATINWTDDANGGATTGPSDETPYLVRWPVGLGEVTWVAQNLGDTTLTHIQTGWIGIWDKVLDLKDAPIHRPADGSVPDQFHSGEWVDLGYSPLPAIEHAARGAILVLLAVGFFILYWVLSGPVAYFVLANKGHKGWNWPAFAVSALAATLLTVGVVKIVLGAQADIHHFTVVRWTPGQPAVAESLFGVYLTKSGNIPITLTKTDPTFISYVSAFNAHPDIDKGGEFVGKQTYYLTVPEEGSTDGTEVDVPFRSTLKKMQARWVGQLPGIDGRPQSIESDYDNARLRGKLVNSTGHDLADVYFVFKPNLQPNNAPGDQIYYLPKWAKDDTLDLDRDLCAKSVPIGSPIKNDKAGPQKGLIVGGNLPPIGRNKTTTGWSDYWFKRVATSIGDFHLNNDSDYAVSFPLLSLYDRLTVTKDAQGDPSRYDLLRRGARKYDMSQSVSAGDLVILASDAANDVNGATQSPLPIGLEVDGDKVASSGVTFYQFALPLKHGTPPPTTQVIEK